MFSSPGTLMIQDELKAKMSRILHEVGKRPHLVQIQLGSCSTQWMKSRNQNLLIKSTEDLNEEQGHVM